MDTNTLLFILGLVALFVFFRGGFRRKNSGGVEQDNTSVGHGSGASSGGCCGGGATHQHHESGDVPEKVDAWIDPVCGMPVESKHAAATKNYKGITYYFCSEKCETEFASNPGKYLEKETVVPAQQSGGGGHGCCG